VIFPTTSAAIVFAAIGLPAIAAGTVTGALIDAANKKTVFHIGGTRGSAGIQSVCRRFRQ